MRHEDEYINCMSSRVRKSITLKSLKKDLFQLVYWSGYFLRSENEQYQFEFNKLEEGRQTGAFSEGSINAALFGALRQYLPKSWYVRSEATYPNSQQSADIMIHAPNGDAIAIEIKRNLKKSAVEDLKKLGRHVKLKRNSIVYGLFVVPLITDEQFDAFLNTMGSSNIPDNVDMFHMKIFK